MAYDITNDATKRQELIEMTGQMGVPILEIDGDYYVGFNETLLRNVLHL